MEETPKVRPLKSSESMLTMDKASRGAVILTDSSRKSMLFAIFSVRSRTLFFPKRQKREIVRSNIVHLC